jgi:prevent-host-death family protein
MMGSARVGAAEFKAHCSDLVEKVHNTESEVSVTQRGREIARLRAAPRLAAGRRPRGGVERSGRFDISGDEPVNFDTSFGRQRELREQRFERRLRDTKPEKSDAWKTLAGTLLWEADDIITPIPGVWDDAD